MGGEISESQTRGMYRSSIVGLLPVGVVPVGCVGTLPIDYVKLLVLHLYISP